jgi:hypothetical protein
VTVTFVDDEPNGLADLVGRLIEANLDRHPERRSLLRPSVVRLSASDAGVEVTIRISERAVEVANGPTERRPHLRVLAGSNDLLDLAGARLLLGLPDPFHPTGRRIVGRLASGDVRVSGMLRHPVRLSRFTRLLSVAT